MEQQQTTTINSTKIPCEKEGYASTTKLRDANTIYYKRSVNTGSGETKEGSRKIKAHKGKQAMPAPPAFDIKKHQQTRGGPFVYSIM